MPIIDKFKDMGTVVMGKVESGTIREGDSLFIMPNKVVFLGRCELCPSVLSSDFSYLLKYLTTALHFAGSSKSCCYIY